MTVRIKVKDGQEFVLEMKEKVKVGKKGETINCVGQICRNENGKCVKIGNVWEP